ncbi:two pore potassium channel c-like isoform X2 [Panicum hallii]|uniref:two pore potassium channel c-like isoform X2 n=1 Tax=Panicum hallii TaxID=206008 RepID=UPI000DF4D9E7|nr:two pore potassium channel c-like isoform X2 [Panicum hallii]
MSSMEEPLLPLVQRDQKYTSKKDIRRSCDVPSRRNRRTTKWILQKKMDNEPLVAGLDNNPAVSKSDFVIYKLKEMGKIDEKDIAMISDQFNQLEFGKCERIPIVDIIGKL